MLGIAPKLNSDKFTPEPNLGLPHLFQTYRGVCSSPGGELQAAQRLGRPTALKLLRRNPKHEYLSAGSTGSQANLEHARTFSLIPRCSESPDATLKKHNGRRNVQKTAVRHSNSECSEFGIAAASEPSTAHVWHSGSQ
jgi:hypothetical protein